jgi:hypothetical protein
VTQQWAARWPLAALALGVAACAADTIVPDVPRVVIEFPIAPFEIHEECVQLAPSDRLDFRFEAQRPVTFEIYYKDGITFIAPVSRGDVTEFSGIFAPPFERRYCLQWEAGREGAIIDYRIRLLRGDPPR